MSNADGVLILISKESLEVQNEIKKNAMSTF